MAHRSGESRGQTTLFPVMLDELVEGDAVVRVIDAWVGSLDLKALGFNRTQTAVTGRPPYDPADLLKLYVYGYLNGVRSSRRLERECLRNVEVMWMLGRLSPDHKTIANFRRSESAALVGSAAAFVQFARAKGLIAGETVAIDGTKLRAVASRKAIVGQRDLAAQAEALRERMRGYLSELDEIDSQEAPTPTRREAVQEALKQLREQQTDVERQAQKLRDSGSSTVVSNEPTARVMKSLHGAPGYNLQTAVDTASHLIVHHEVVSDTSDRGQLEPVAKAAAKVLENLALNVIADKGYSNGEQLEAVQAEGLTVLLPPQRSINSEGDRGHYDRSVFKYDAATNSWTCPAGQLMKQRGRNLETKILLYAPEKGVCKDCPQKPNCTSAKRRWVSRSFFEDALQACQKRLDDRPEAMRQRRSTVEHPYGTIKDHILGNARLLMRGLAGARAELSLAVLAYNLKRVVNMKGSDWMRNAAAA
jgi:transposase